MKDELTIRKASSSDVEEIWELMRIEKELWSTEKILMNIEDLFVIIYKNSIISVLYGTLKPGMEKIYWVLGHPMYPEKAVCNLMIFWFWGILCRNPVEEAVLELQTNKIKIGIKSKKARIFTNNEAEGVLNEVSIEQGIGVSYLSTARGTD